jgi:hypothetical protein
LVHIPTISSGIGDLLIFLIGLVILWVVISMPVHTFGVPSPDFFPF